MLKYCLLCIVGFFAFTIANAQAISYTVANGHAHNDYEHNVPLVQAYRLGFGSIEADVILKNDSLYVGHSFNDIATRPLFFERDYIQPLNKLMSETENSSRKVILLIDLKTDALPTLNKVIGIMEKYPLLTKPSGVQFVITGNQPAPATFEQYPDYIYFDGNIRNPEHIRHLSRIALFSDNFKNYSAWNGKRKLREKEKRVLDAVIEEVHALKKPIRFWGCPDNLHVWQVFMKMQIDYINTDHIQQFADFINSRGSVRNTADRKRTVTTFGF